MAEVDMYRSKFVECQEELNSCLKEWQADYEVFASNIAEETEAFVQKMQIFAKTGDLNAAGLSNATKELNNESDQENVHGKRGRGRKKKPALADNTDDNLQVQIKEEKRSTSSQSESTRNSAGSTVSSIAGIPVGGIKVEQSDMPAPSWIPPPKKKAKEIKKERASVRSTRTRGKKATVRDSDVIVQNATITTIDLSDTEESEVEQEQQKKERPIRSTRTKTKKTRTDTDSGTETDTESTRSTRNTRTKTRNLNNAENIESSEIEETRSTRTKTIRKAKKVEEEKPNEPEETRSTRTKTIKKVASLQVDTTDSSSNNNKEDTIAGPTKTTKNIAEKTTEKEVVASDIENNSKAEAAKPVPKPSNQGKTKRNRSSSSGEEAHEKKRSNTTSPVQDIEANATVQTVYDDARSTIGVQPLNSTYVATTSGSNNIAPVPPLNATVTIEAAASNAANSTVVVDKPQFNLFNKNSMDAMFTDDDSIEIKKTTPKKGTTSKASKEVFSPYEKTTLKKKVEAFEKLQNGSEIPVKAPASSRSARDTPSKVKEKAKMFTPLGSRFLPTNSSTSKLTKSISQHHNSTSRDSCMKSAQKDSRERQKKQIEREQALKKKEAMLQAQAEAKRKLNEEKQLRAQQQRKVLEAEKLKQLEAQKQKEAKHKEREREREEYMQKHKLELERKRAEAKKKMIEMQAQRQQILDEQAKHPPIYMTTKLPKLPTEDCYDSDDPDYKTTVPPKWCNGDYARRKQLVQLSAGEKIKNTLFSRHAQTPDLVEIFEVIDPKKLKRSSSVLWRKPPRYTMMPDLNDTRFEEDDELYDSD